MDFKLILEKFCVIILLLLLVKTANCESNDEESQPEANALSVHNRILGAGQSCPNGYKKVGKRCKYTQKDIWMENNRLVIEIIVVTKRTWFCFFNLIYLSWYVVNKILI